MERSEFEQMARTWREKALSTCRRYGADEAAIVSLSTSPHEELEMKEDEEWLSQKLKQMPTTQRTLLYLRQVERRSHEEIASLLGIETTSVSTLLARARRTLLEEIRRRNQI